MGSAASTGAVRPRPSNTLGRFAAAASLALLAAGCNYPVDAPTATESLDLGQIEAAVGATLIAEGELTQSAGDANSDGNPEADPQAKPGETATPAQSNTSVPSDTPASTGTTTPTATPTLPPTNTPQPSITPQPSDTPKPTSPPPPTNTQQPAPTACAKFTNASLKASGPGEQGRVTLTWGSSGGCSPISGTIAASYEGARDPYRKHEISGSSGKTEDQIPPPDPCKEDIYVVEYMMVLFDATGVSITGAANVQIRWDC